MAKMVDWWKAPSVARILKENKLQKEMGGREMSTGNFTGLGPDGQLQPSNVTGIHNFALHEGEFAVDAPKVQALGGPEAVNKILEENLSKVQGIGTQEQMNQMAQGLPGFQAGGSINNPFGNKITDIAEIEKRKEPATTNQATTDNIRLGGVSLADAPPSEAPAIVKGLTGRTGLGEQDRTVLDSIRTPSPPKTTEPPAGIGAPSNQAFTAGLNKLQALMQGDDPVMRNQANTLLNQLSAGGAAAQAALNQQAAQLGLSPQEALALQAFKARDVESAKAQAAGQIALGAQQRGLEAAGVAAGLGLQGMSLEEQKRQFQMDFDEGVRQFDVGLQVDSLTAAVEAGDFTGANNAAAALGWNIDFSNLQDTQQRKLVNTGLTNAQTLITNYSDPASAMQDSVLMGDLRLAWDNMPEGDKEGTTFEEWSEKHITTVIGANTPMGQITRAIPLDDAINNIPGVTDETTYNQFLNDAYAFYMTGGIDIIDGDVTVPDTDAPGYAAYAKWFGIDVGGGTETETSTTGEGAPAPDITTTDFDNFVGSGDIRYDPNTNKFYTQEGDTIVESSLDDWFEDNRPAAGTVALVAPNRNYYVQKDGEFKEIGDPGSVNIKDEFGIKNTGLIFNIRAILDNESLSPSQKLNQIVALDGLNKNQISDIIDKFIGSPPTTNTSQNLGTTTTTTTTTEPGFIATADDPGAALFAQTIDSLPPLQKIPVNTIMNSGATADQKIEQINNLSLPEETKKIIIGAIVANEG